jgi:sugar phosphate isomerase/epimerase
MLTIETVAILGTGERAQALALLSALAGCAARLFDPDPGALARASEGLRRRVDLAVEAGALTPTERQRTLDGVLFTPDLSEAVTGADLAADLSDGASAPRLAEVARWLRASAAIAARAPAGEEVARVPHPGRVLGLALAETGGPLHRLDVFALATTGDHALERATRFAARVNRAARTAR